MVGNLKQVARVAQVSIATASRVLSGSTYPVSDELRARVMAVAEELDYVPNMQARALIQGNTRLVGMLVGEVGDPYFDAMINGTHRVAAADGCLVTILGTGREAARELESFRLLQSHGASTIIVAGSGLDDESYSRKLNDRIRRFTGTTVLIGRHHVDADLDPIRVTVDNVQGGRLLGEHLASLGHARVGVLSGLADMTSTIDRISGLTEGLGHAPRVLEVPPTRDGGFNGAQELLAAEPGLTAIVGTADQMAIGALAYCTEHNISVPGELSVAGCNDIWVAKEVTPSLTSIHVPLNEMGATALRLALEEDGAREQSFEASLMVRDSTGPVRTP